ncbi:heme oxygenase [Sphingomonas vulcanisoli]|uniref:Heme oxygenase n=1 Tax=Sphingomonas vulcanisoli TaxID=1658060 RepID=A0ABX0TU96_9SPHN|nr:biliverdin-producing heme oxygenase [Sphingomonas vulcanisoli]NIJ09099.1 heme oxygenase [Sphingomonas vulcanisoli]
MAGSPTAHSALRAATAGRHENVDAHFGRFDLADRDGYIGFLEAHARALPAVEAVLAGLAEVPPLRPRAALLADDLAALGRPMPAALDLPPPADAAEAFGYAYVIEGSRLGGSMLARGVPESLPKAYLNAGHLPGEWRAFGAALDDAAEAGGAEWLERAADGAARVFALYAEAAKA